MIALDRNEITPPEFTILDHTPSGKDANLNFGSKGKLTYLCVRYLKHGLRITSLTMVPQLQKETMTDSFRLRTTVGGADATLGEKSKEPYQLCFSKNWSDLMLTPSCLRCSKSVLGDGVVPESNDVEKDHVEMTTDMNKYTIDTTKPVQTPDAPVPVPDDSIPLNNGDDTIPLNNTDDTMPNDTVIHEDSLGEIPDGPPPSEPLHNSLNIEDLPSSIPQDLDLDEIPITEPSIDVEVIRQTAAVYRNQTRNLLPLLVGCHCGDSAIVHICVEHLYHFINSQPVETPKGLRDLSTEVILNCIYEGTLPTLSLSICEIQYILMKIVGYFETIPQTTLGLLLRIFSSLTLYLFRLEDKSLISSQQYDQANKGQRAIASLITTRTQPESEKNDEIPIQVTSSIIEDILASYAYKLESPGALLAGEMIDDMMDVCKRISGNLFEQNLTLFLLVLLGDLRRYGRVFILLLFYS